MLPAASREGAELNKGVAKLKTLFRWGIFFGHFLGKLFGRLQKGPWLRACTFPAQSGTPYSR